jgi:large subunit ribosomal protein L9
MKTGKDDKLFGSVHAANILSTLKGQGVELGKDCIVLEEPLDQLGIFEVPVNLHPNVIVALKVWVVKE